MRYRVYTTTEEGFELRHATYAKSSEARDKAREIRKRFTWMRVSVVTVSDDGHEVSRETFGGRP